MILYPADNATNCGIWIRHLRGTFCQNTVAFSISFLFFLGWVCVCGWVRDGALDKVKFCPEKEK